MRLIIFTFLVLASLPRHCLAQDHQKVCFTGAGICVDAELALSESARVRGLMFRERLTDNQAMLFVFPQSDIYKFWMKNMVFALDIIWISEDKKAVEIKKYVAPCKNEFCADLTPAAKAKYVLEVNAGFCNKYKIKVGDKVRF